MQLKTFAKHLGVWAVLACCSGWSASSSAGIVLFDIGVNIDSAITTGAIDVGASPSVIDSEFDYGTGLGKLSIMLAGTGAHYVSLFVDHELSEETTTFFNENGSVSGAPAAGQSWEIDEPGYMFGDIFANFLAGTLGNDNGVPASGDDVSMALAWSFVLGLDETAIIDFVLSEVMPTSGFFLTQADPDSNEFVYFASTLSIRGVAVPEPDTSLLLGAGLVMLGGLAQRRRRATGIAL